MLCRGGWTDALSRSGWMEVTLNKIDALNRGDWMDALSTGG